jgi:hypothetical protein
MHSKTVLIVDRDLGFVFWLGQHLDNIGYQALPAKGSVDATAILRELHVEIDLLIVNPDSDGASALTEALRRSQGHLKVITISSQEKESSVPFRGANASHYRPSFLDEASKAEWLETIERVLGVRDVLSGQAGIE